MKAPPAEEYVYAITADEHPGLLKIGRTTDVNKRLSQLQVGSPYKLKLAYVHECENNTWAEAMVQERLSVSRVSGEWYKVTVEEFKEACRLSDIGYESVLSEESICTQLTLARYRKGLTQSDLALLTGLRQATISRIESGKGGNIKTYLVIAEALGLKFFLQNSSCGSK